MHSTVQINSRSSQGNRRYPGGRGGEEGRGEMRRRRSRSRRRRRRIYSIFTEPGKGKEIQPLCKQEEKSACQEGKKKGSDREKKRKKRGKKKRYRGKICIKGEN